MKYKLTATGFGNTGIFTLYFEQRYKAQQAARSMLLAAHPVEVTVMEHVTGQGYTKEVLSENNHVTVGLTEP